MVVEDFEGGSRGLDVDVPYLGSTKVRLEALEGFYVYCMAEACDVRMFDDFTTETSNVDTCVVVARPNEFKARLRRAIEAQLPGWRLFHNPIQYFDPFFSRVHLLTPHFSKHVRFDYQKEYRFIWMPS